MKKTTLVIAFGLLLAFYVAYERINAAPAAVVASSSAGPSASSAPAASAVSPSSSSSGSSGSSAAAGSGNPPASAGSSSAAPAQQSGAYRNGTYVGPSVNAYYGNVKVEAVVSGGQLANVKFLEYPNTHPASVYINSQAMPYLTQEAVQAQNANVNIISGATFTSEAFVQSLGAALAQAKN